MKRERRRKGAVLKCASSFPLLAQRIHLDIRVGEHDLDAAIAQAKDKVNEVSFKLEHLIEQIEQIVKEQNYQRVSLPVQFILSLPARNVTPQTKSLNQGRLNSAPWSFSLSHTAQTHGMRGKAHSVPWTAGCSRTGGCGHSP